MFFAIYYYLSLRENRKKEIEKIKQQTTEEIRKIEETKNSRIAELEKELQILKELYEQRQKEKEEKQRQSVPEKNKKIKGGFAASDAGENADKKAANSFNI